MNPGYEGAMRWMLAVVTVFVMACSVAPQSEPDGGEATPGKQEDGTTTVEEFEADVRGAVGIAEDYWSDYAPVRRVVAYRDDGELACGGQAIPRNNAAYCPAGDFIAYDVNWAVAAFRQIGDAFVFYLLGHEYAHAIQARLGISHRFSVEHELQADCMAGAMLGDSVRAKALTLDEGDLEEFRRGLHAVGDDEGQPWFAPESHGTADQRTEAFNNGYRRSLGACGL